MNAAELYKEDRRHSLISYSVSILVHGIILLLLWFFVIMPPNPPLSENGGSGSLISPGFENMGGTDLMQVQQLLEPGNYARQESVRFLYLHYR